MKEVFCVVKQEVKSSKGDMYIIKNYFKTLTAITHEREVIN